MALGGFPTAKWGLSIRAFFGFEQRMAGTMELQPPSRERRFRPSSECAFSSDRRAENGMIESSTRTIVTNASKSTLFEFADDARRTLDRLVREGFAPGCGQEVGGILFGTATLD